MYDVEDDYNIPFSFSAALFAMFILPLTFLQAKHNCVDDEEGMGGYLGSTFLWLLRQTP